MSFTVVRDAIPRPNRSELAVPGSSRKFLEKAATSSADMVFLDLEDAVAPDDKEEARKNVIEAINDLDWGDRTVSVRINGADTHYMYRDVVDLMEQSSERLDLIMLPKAGTASDVYALDMLCTQIEAAKGRKKRVGFELLIESALGMANVDEIAAASDRNESLHFGVADFSASTQARTTAIGGPIAGYAVLSDPDDSGARDSVLGDPWHYSIQRIVIAARSNGLRPIDGPFGDFSDADGYRAQAQRAAALGCEGKWAIHPSQIELANEVYSPGADEIARAKRILEAMEQAQKEGKGAVSLDGRLIDLASIRQADALVVQAERLGIS